MQIMLMRHGLAVEPADWSGPDRTRPLSPAGTSQLTAALPSFRKSGVQPGLVLSSPFERAKRTAELLAEALQVAKLEMAPELSAGARLPAFRALIARHAAEQFVCVVAHMPEIGGFASSLTGDPILVEQGLKPAEALCADCAVSGRGPEPGRLLWRRRVDEW